MPKAIVMGVHSFADQRVRVGTQYIAQGLAENGWEVDYISVPSSPFDIYGPERQKRLRRIWIYRQDLKGIDVKPRLKEYAFRCLYPAHKFFLRKKSMLDYFARLAPDWLQKSHYDICIHDITVNILFLPMIKARVLVLRLNDSPEGFGFHIDRALINRFREKISSLTYNEIWAVSEPLAQYARELNPANNVVVIPNGIEDHFKFSLYKNKNSIKKAIYLGSISSWVDLELLDQTAMLLKDWQFHLYGPLSRPWKTCSGNIQRFAPVAREAIPQLLAGYQVGLIPFRDTCGRMKYVERPLKFYEYIGAGLGIASTDIGALKKGMGALAFYGNTPPDFAEAVIQAAEDGTKRTDEFNRTFIKNHNWRSIIQNMCKRISTLKGR